VAAWKASVTAKREAGAAMSAATVKTIRVTEVIGAEVTYDLVGELVNPPV